MKIIKILSQYRRDFTALFQCENSSCGHTQEIGGYDDRNYHDNVIPKMECKKCGKSSEDLGTKHEPMKTKYSEYETV